jgi:hypothetical protein
MSPSGCSLVASGSPTATGGWTWVCSKSRFTCDDDTNDIGGGCGSTRCRPRSTPNRCDHLSQLEVTMAAEDRIKSIHYPAGWDGDAGG